MQNHRGLEHLNHEGRLSAGYVVGCSNACEDLVAISDPRLLCRNKTADLSHQNDQGSLTQKGRFTGHIRTGQDNHLLLTVVKVNIIWNEFLSSLHHGFDNRMTALPYIYFLAVIYLRTAISVAHCQISETTQHIKTRKYTAVLLDSSYVGLNCSDKFAIYLGFKGIDTFFRPKNLLFIFLQFLCDITLCVYEGLFPYPLCRNTVLVCVADFEIVSEDIVESYLE